MEAQSRKLLKMFQFVCVIALASLPTRCFVHTVIAAIAISFYAVSFHWSFDYIIRRAFIVLVRNNLRHLAYEVHDPRRHLP